MNTKEAIGCLTPKFSSGIIDLLKRGEKYEKMWKYFKKIYIKEDNTFKLHNEWGYFCDIEEMTKDLEQKYFPKE